MSGSKYLASCNSIKEELETLAKDKNSNYTQTVIEFDSVNTTFGSQHNLRLIEHYWLSSLNPTKFKGYGAYGGTPLYNTMGKIFKRLEQEVKPEDKVLIKVFTDGGDTDYGQGDWNISSIREYINTLIEVNKWTITFNCTHSDKHNILRIGVPESNILCHDNTALDIKRVSELRTNMTLSYSKSVSRGVDASELTQSFYTKKVE